MTLLAGCQLMQPMLCLPILVSSTTRTIPATLHSDILPVVSPADAGTFNSIFMIRPTGKEVTGKGVMDRERGSEHVDGPQERVVYPEHDCLHWCCRGRESYSEADPG